MTRLTRRDFWTFERSREYVKSLSLSSFTEWKKYCKSSLRPPYIPSNPHHFYKNNGWVSYIDWLGSKNLRPNERKYIVNDKYFKKWSHNMAYILGFWWADGYIDEKRGIFILTQHKKDIQLFKDILEDMRSNYPIKAYGNKKCKDYIRVDIRSKNIVKDIIRLGGKQRKSLVIDFPSVPKKYLPDFVRGLWDGDGYVGWIWNDKRHITRKINSSISSGSKRLIASLYEVLRANIKDIKGKIKIDKRKKGTMQSNNTLRNKDQISYNIVFYPNDTRRLRDFIYQNNGISMSRKKKIFYEAGNKREFWDYNKAKNYVKNLSILTGLEWSEYSKSGKRPLYIPAFPPDVYKDKGWVSWMSWLGTDKSKKVR